MTLYIQKVVLLGALIAVAITVGCGASLTLYKVGQKTFLVKAEAEREQVRQINTIISSLSATISPVGGSALFALPSLEHIEQYGIKITTGSKDALSRDLIEYIKRSTMNVLESMFTAVERRKIFDKVELVHNNDPQTTPMGYHDFLIYVHNPALGSSKWYIKAKGDGAAQPVTIDGDIDVPKTVAWLDSLENFARTTRTRPDASVIVENKRPTVPIREQMNFTLASTEQRTALVIGNSAYSSGPLKNPVNDAADMAAMLKKLGFSVTLKQNAKQQEMDETIEAFGNSLKRGGVGLFYYAGHGVQVNGTNYLLPIGARINKEADVKYQAVDANKILDEMATANNGFNIVMLDACRDNPYARSFRNVTRGLAIVSSAPSGTFISYSTSPGNVARDGDGRNSPYTEALLENIAKPGLTINDVFMNVRTKVKKETGQVPWELSSLEGRFYFAPQGSSQNNLSDASSNTPLPESDELAEQKAALERERQELARVKQELERQKALDTEREQLAAERRKIEAEKQQLAIEKRPFIPSAQNQQDPKRIDISRVSLTSALVMGIHNASKKVIIFTDPD